MMAVATLSVLMLGGSPAFADSIAYSLEDVGFDDGGTASGTFSVDSTTGDLLSYDIITTAGSVLPGQEYDPANSFVDENAFSPNSFILDLDDASLYVTFAFASSLTGGGTISIEDGFNSYECTDCGTYRLVTSGDVTTVTTSVPEPASLAIFGTGLAGLSWLRRRKAV